MNIRKLAHLLAVIESRSLRSAADMVHLSQPALTRSLQSLEEELGIQLLDRMYGRVVPTAHSAPVVEHIRKLLSEARALQESVRRIKGLEEGEIRVGFGPFAAVAALRAVSSELVSHYPRLGLRIELANSPLLIELLLQDRLDLVVCDSRYLVDGDVQVIKLPRQPMAFAVGKTNPLRRRRGRLTMDDLRQHPIGAPTLPADLLATFREHGFDDFPTVACDEMRVLLDLSANTSMVAMLPQLVVDGLGREQGVAALPVDVPFDPFAYPCIMHPKGRTLGPAATMLMELVHKRLSQVPDGGPAMLKPLKAARRRGSATSARQGR
ncbi:LysR family transcriptional regulator [Hydrogenophaga sp.]|uniref:LysR family transcriptional regulator n=1 Tax=Hydrogenophaga sp. TaxID=1904254 RepID=UPI002C5DC8FA|nr:LysR family transcriptional regulator [Hydrogenophaga sp.]HMP09500.1 LysR family transcriptional regulator [Hydrogenophaga sp.]